MPGVTPNYGWPIFLLSDPPDGADQPASAFVAIDAQLAQTDANVASLQANLVSLLYGNSSAAFTQPAVAVAPITSTAYLAVKDGSGNVIAGAVFVTPPSGKVWIDYGMGVHPGAGDTVTVTVAVNTGNVLNAGTPVVAALDVNGFASSAAGLTVPGSRRLAVVGLTPNATFNTFILWKSSSTASAAGAHPYIAVTPIVV